MLTHLQVLFLCVFNVVSNDDHTTPKEFENAALFPTSFPGSSLYLEKVAWLQLVTCLCMPKQTAQRVVSQLNFVNTV